MIKGNHIYHSCPKINSICDWEIKTKNEESEHEMLVFRKKQKNKDVAEHVADTFPA